MFPDSQTAAHQVMHSRSPTAALKNLPLLIIEAKKTVHFFNYYYLAFLQVLVVIDMFSMYLFLIDESGASLNI